MSQNKPSDKLKKPRRPLVTAAVILGSVIALSGMGAGAYAISQAVSATEMPVASEPTPPEAPNVEPSASFSVLSVDGLTVTVDGANSYDPEGPISEYVWDFGDGGTASGAAASHVYGAYGTYTITLTVTDADGATGAFSTDVDLIAPPPPPPPPPGPVKCPAGSTANSSDGYNDTSCFPNVCFTIAVPDPAHPECDATFKP